MQVVNPNRNRSSNRNQKPGSKKPEDKPIDKLTAVAEKPYNPMFKSQKNEGA